MNAILFTLHFAATWSMVGLCWLVQRVQYPLMAEVGRDAFPGYETGHVARIGPVVAPLMLTELLRTNRVRTLVWSARGVTRRVRCTRRIGRAVCGASR